MKTNILSILIISLVGASFFSCVLRDDEKGDLTYRFENTTTDTIRLVRFSHQDAEVKWDSVHIYSKSTYNHKSDYFVDYEYIEYNKWYDSVHIHYQDSYLVRHYPDNRNGLSRPVFEYNSWDFSKKTVNNSLSDRLFEYIFTDDDLSEAKIKGSKY